MKAIILAAGRGSRMGNATSDLPKCRTIFRGKELIQWQLEALRGAGIQEIAIVRGYLAETFEFDLTYFDNISWAETNMVMSLAAASEWLESDDCIVSYSDIVYSQNAVSRLKKSDSELAITYDPNWLKLWSLRFQDPLSDAETFRLNRGCVIEIGQHTSSIDEIEGQYMGLLKLSPNGWKTIESFIGDHEEKDQHQMDMTMLLQGLIEEGTKISAVPIADEWFEIDSQDDLAAYTLSAR